MDNNDVFRRLRYALDFRDATLAAYFAESGVEISRERLRAFLKQEEEPEFEPLSDELFGKFLDGMIIARRGRREGAPGEAAPAPMAMNNNRVLRAFRIAFELKDADIIAMMRRANLLVSKAELSALFRRESHPNFQPCGDQFLRNFLQGLTVHYRQPPSE